MIVKNDKCELTHRRCFRQSASCVSCLINILYGSPYRFAHEDSTEESRRKLRDMWIYPRPLFGIKCPKCGKESVFVDSEGIHSKYCSSCGAILEI